MELRTLRRWLAGEDAPDRRALPAGEFLAPVPLIAVLALIVNDWVLKGSAAPAWLTGKLSDVAGLIFFPLLVTSVVDCILLAAYRAGARVDFSLRRSKLLVSIGATALLFASINLSPAVAGAVERCLSWVLPASITVDPTDLFALVALAVPYRIGVAHIARLPLGRLEVVRRRVAEGGSAWDSVRDVVGCGANEHAVSALVTAIEQDSPQAISAALDQLRGEFAKSP